MILSALALSIAVAAPQQPTAKVEPPASAPVTLSRVFTKGEKLQYAIASNLHVETRPYGLQTFMPDDLDINYKFTVEVRDVKNEGFALVHYMRPNMVQIDGENADRPAKTTVEPVNINMDLTVSPINDIIDQKDLNPPKDPKKPKKTGGGGDDGGDGLSMFSAAALTSPKQSPLDGILQQFVGEVYRLALNIGSLDSALDFAPKLPLDEVKIGDTWKKTVGYQPQKLKGKNEQAVQRLDYTFTYKGLVTINGKQYHRVNAALDLKTDLGSFINQMFDAKPEQTHLKSIPLTLSQSIDYDLDLATKRTVAAHSTATGGFEINTTVTDEPIREEKMSGKTEMRLVSVSMGTPVKATPKKTKGGHARH